MRRLLALALLLPALAAPALAGPTIAVTLVVDGSAYPSATLAGTVTCPTVVPVGSVASAVLDRATLDACIAGWAGAHWPTAPQWGRVVYAIDRFATGNCIADWAVQCSFWSYDLNGEYATQGVDLQPVAEGDVLRFEFVHLYGPELP